MMSENRPPMTENSKPLAREPGGPRSGGRCSFSTACLVGLGGVGGEAQARYVAALRSAARRARRSGRG